VQRWKNSVKQGEKKHAAIGLYLRHQMVPVTIRSISVLVMKF
jgi:hypothetical protein